MTVNVDLTRGGAKLADDVIELRDAAMLDLPEGAQLQPDGSVLLPLLYPRTLRTKRPGQDVVEVEYTELVLHRLTGAQTRKVLAAPESKSTQVAIALALDMRAADAAVLMDRLDAADVSAIGEVLAALLGIGKGLPDQVEELDGVYFLPLREPIEAVSELAFHRLTGADLTEIARAKETLPVAMARSTRRALPAMNALFDEMDGADVIAASRVIGFLSRNGRTTGR